MPDRVARDPDATNPTDPVDGPRLEVVIEELRATERRLRRSEAHLAAAQRVARCGSWEADLAEPVDLAASRLRCTDEAFRIYGHEPRAELPAAAFFAALHPDDHAGVVGALQRTIATGVPFALDHRILRADGAIRILHGQAELRRDATGRPEMLIGTVIDVTEQRQATRREHDHDALLRLVLDSIAEGVIVAAAPDGHVILRNPAATRLLGTAGGDAGGDWPARNGFFLPDQVTPFPSEQGTLLRALRGEQTDEVEMFLRRPDGHEHWTCSRGRPLLAADGTLIGGVTVIRDVTEQRLAERKLVESRAQWQALVENAPDIIINIDRDGTIRSINRTRGQQLEQVIGTPWRSHLPAHTWAPIEQALTTVFATGEPATVETADPDRSGELTWYSSSIGPVRKAGAIVGAVMVIRDVTQRKHTEARLSVADRMASIGTLAAGVAHEINNPLAAVVSNLELVARHVSELGRRIAVPPELLAELRDARDGAERVRQIVVDLKVFARSEDDQRGPVDVHSVLESMLRMASNEIRHRAQLVKALAPVPAVLANESRLGQVFLNLLVNAAQAIPEGHSEQNQIRIATTTDREGRVVITIADTGAGIPPDARGRIFTPFFTTKPVGVGTGLGLSICHRIVTSLGGEISFDSVLGTGTVFRVVLPALVPAVPAPAAAPASPTAPVPDTAPRRGRILLVDDEPILTRIVERVLAADHAVIACNSAMDALVAIRADPRFDVILCDLMMPQMTGMDLHAELLRSLPDQAARMVFLTGGAFTPRARGFLDTVPNQRIEKPFTNAGLRALIDELVRAR